jgi:protein involved in polysaccharide export with SLBB domain
MNTPFSRLTALSFAALFLSGCQSWRHPPGRATLPPAPAPVAELVSVAPAQPLDAALLKPGAEVFRLGPGDKLDIEVMGDAATRATVTVGPDGKIYYYILPGTDVWGLTLRETRERIGRELQRFLREKPAVAVSLRAVASQRVWVLGRVGTPGVYTLGGPTTLLDAIAQGGGLSSGDSGASRPGGFAAAATSGSGSESADLSRAFVIRQGKMVPVDFQKLLREGDLTQNIYLQADDFIFLPPLRTAEVHVLGAVSHPQSQKMSGVLTVAQAVALSGGTVADAYITNVAILRGSLTQPKVAIIDLAGIVSGRIADVRLEPGDIIYVPFTPYRTLTRYVDLILDTFARTVGVNAGAHAAGGNVSASVGVNVSTGR